MKFYGNGVVWDSKNNKRLCKFINGELETDDSRIIGLLQKAGYRSDEIAETEQGDTEGQEVEAEQEDEGIELEEMTYNELKSLAKAEGITVGHKNKADLIEALKEGV